MSGFLQDRFSPSPPAQPPMKWLIMQGRRSGTGPRWHRVTATSSLTPQTPSRLSQARFSPGRTRGCSTRRSYVRGTGSPNRATGVACDRLLSRNSPRTVGASTDATIRKRSPSGGTLKRRSRRPTVRRSLKQEGSVIAALEASGDRALSCSRSKRVPRLSAWAAEMPSRPFACVLAVSLASAAPCPDWRQSKDHLSSFLSLDLFAVRAIGV